MGNERLSVSLCYWREQAYSAIEPIGNVDDSKRKRPCYIHV